MRKLSFSKAVQEVDSKDSDDDEDMTMIARKFRNSLSPRFSYKLVRTRYICKTVVELNHLLYNGGSSRKRLFIKQALPGKGNQSSEGQLLERKKLRPTLHKSRKIGVIFASAEDEVTINGSPETSTISDVKKKNVKINQSLQGEDYTDELLLSLHDGVRVFQLEIEKKSLLSKIPWFSTTWLGMDKNAWVKAFSYQASVYSLLQAAIEISSRGDGRDRDLNAFVQRSLSLQSVPLESVIRESLLANQPVAYDWFWSEQVPLVVTTFVNFFERDPRFTASTALTLNSSGTSDISLLRLSLTCIAGITKLGAAKVSCSQFFSMLPETNGRLMDMLVDLIPISQAYQSIKDIGLLGDFLPHFGARAAACRLKNDTETQEVVFWVDLLQKRLQRAIDRERIWSRLTTTESIEVLERDLAIFGFFIALGRSTQTFLYENGFDVVDEPLEGFIRYLISGSVLYYPQLSSISSYQLYVEVVCEELDWLPLYPGITSTSKRSNGHRSQSEGSRNVEAISEVVDVCSYWMQSFIKYSEWLESCSNVKAARFLSRGHNKLTECTDDLGLLTEDKIDSMKESIERTQPQLSSSAKKEPNTFNKALESVEEALSKLEHLLEKQHVSSSKSGHEHLKAVCSDLEKIRKLKKEAEFLEASFRAKAASLQQVDDDRNSKFSLREVPRYKGKNGLTSNTIDRSNSVVSKPSGLWSFLVPNTTTKLNPVSSTVNGTGREPLEQVSLDADVANIESNEILRFEQLRSGLIELEKRVQRSKDRSDYNEDPIVTKDTVRSNDKAAGTPLVQVQKTEDIIGKSIGKLKEASTDVLQGTQLLAIDVGAAMELLRRGFIGDEITDKEKQALKRTLTDLASVVPIGVLMLLPVTAVGHAAMLAAIQRYVPALIPSTYGPERLALLRQLEKIKDMESTEVSEENSDENVQDLV